MADVTDRFAERIRAASIERPLRIRGGGSKDFYGNALAGEILDTRGHAGIVAYEPTELVITARCGTPLAEVEAALAAQGQFLPFDPPAFDVGGSDGATIGGVVAAGLSGPRRAAAGSLRDFVLGVRILDGEARRLTFGGQVMKNVAGFDVSRLMAGSLGTLGLILEVSLKVLPRAVAQATLRFELPQARAIETMNAWAGRPLPVASTCWQDGALTVCLSGARAAVLAACEKLGGEALAEAEAEGFWADLREQRLAFFAGGEPLWRLSLPSVAPVLDLPGEPLVEWGGAQRWLRGGEAGSVRAAAAHAGGHAVLFRGQDKSAGVFQPLAPALMQIHRRLKAAFDPRGVLNPGRLYPDF
jgi:glycolate oxidase FAD binding subunit